VGTHRDSTNILASVLKAGETGAGITRLMISANLSYELAKKYLKIATESGLLQHNKKHYETTEKGKRYLQTQADIQTANLQIQELAKTVAYKKTMLRQLLSAIEPLMAQDEQSQKQDEIPKLNKDPHAFKRIDYEQFFQELKALGFKSEDAIEIISWINAIAETKFSVFFGKKSVTIKACIAYIGGKFLNDQKISQRDVARFYKVYPSTIQRSFKQYQDILEKAKPEIFKLQSLQSKQTI
jgi:predicted transcriptional regulator